MWRGVRCTLRRISPSCSILARVRLARRIRTSFLSLIARPPSLLLRFLDHDLLVRVAHALALVGLWRTKSADVGRHLSDQALVHALDHDLGLARRLHRDAFRDVVVDRVREAEREPERLALGRGAITDANQRQLALEA